MMNLHSYLEVTTTPSANQFVGQTMGILQMWDHYDTAAKENALQWVYDIVDAVGRWSVLPDVCRSDISDAVLDVQDHVEAVHGGLGDDDAAERMGLLGAVLQLGLAVRKLD